MERKGKMISLFANVYLVKFTRYSGSGNILLPASTPQQGVGCMRTPRILAEGVNSLKNLPDDSDVFLRPTH